MQRWIVFPYQMGDATVMVEVDVRFDGSEVAIVEVGAGYWHTSFLLDLSTGEVIPPPV